VPAPATIKSGPDLSPFCGSGSPWDTAFRCGTLSFSRWDGVDTRRDYT